MTRKTRPSLGPALLALAFVSLAAWSWRKWPDVQIDFGSQLYIPWQLSVGKVLYTDIVYKEGPLSPYFNAGLFRVFGVSLTTLIWSNLAILAALCGGVYRIFGRAFGPATATLACLTLLGVFGFSQYTGYGNCNYICPYEHEQTHGLFLAVAMIVCLGEWAYRARLRWCAVAGVCLGLVFLTKAELFVPAVGAAAVGLGLMLASRAGGARHVGRTLLTFVGAALLPVAGCFLFLLGQMPAGTAARALAGNWMHVGAGLLADTFYGAAMGVDDPWGNLWQMAKVFGVVVGVVTAACGADALFDRGRYRRPLWRGLAGAAVFVVLVWAFDRVPWNLVGRALPLTTLVAAVALGVVCINRRDDRDAVMRLIPVVAWAVLALLLLGKVLLKVRLSHYGFVLAMPATVLLVACLTGGIPAWLRARRGGGDLAGALLVACVLAGVVFHLRWSHGLYAVKDLVIDRGGDTIVAENPRWNPRAAVMASAEQRLRTLTPPGATLVVMPEGLMLNYWLRRANPTPFWLYVPPAFRFFGGEAAIVQSLQAHPPDFIALVHRDTEEFGYGGFGVDPRYGREIMAWVSRHYVRVQRIGAEPFRDGRFGIVILRRE